MAMGSAEEMKMSSRALLALQAGQNSLLVTSDCPKRVGSYQATDILNDGASSGGNPTRFHAGEGLVEAGSKLWMFVLRPYLNTLRPPLDNADRSLSSGC